MMIPRYCRMARLTKGQVEGRPLVHDQDDRIKFLKFGKVLKESRHVLLRPYRLVKETEM